MKMPDNLDASLKRALAAADVPRFLGVSAALGLRAKACRPQGAWVPFRLFVVPASGAQLNSASSRLCWVITCSLLKHSTSAVRLLPSLGDRKQDAERRSSCLLCITAADLECHHVLPAQVGVCCSWCGLCRCTRRACSRRSLSRWAQHSQSWSPCSCTARQSHRQRAPACRVRCQDGAHLVSTSVLCNTSLPHVACCDMLFDRCCTSLSSAVLWQDVRRPAIGCTGCISRVASPTAAGRAARSKP